MLRAGQDKCHLNRGLRGRAGVGRALCQVLEDGWDFPRWTGPAREAVSPGPEGEVHHGRMRACQEGRTPKTAGGRAGWGETAPPRASYPPG